MDLINHVFLAPPGIKLHMQRRLFLTAVSTGLAVGVSGCSSLIDVEGPEDPDVEAPDLDKDGNSATHGGFKVGVVSFEVTKERYARMHQSICIEQVQDPDMVFLRVLIQAEKTGDVAGKIDEDDVALEIVDSPSPAIVGCEVGSEYEITGIQFEQDGYLFTRTVSDDFDSESCTLELSWRGVSENKESFQFEFRNKQTRQRNADQCEGGSFAVRIGRKGGEGHFLFDASDVNPYTIGTPQNGKYSIEVGFTSTTAETIESRLREVGALDNSEEFKFLVLLDSRVVARIDFKSELADAIDRGEWDGEFQLMFEDLETADKVAYSLNRSERF